ncbi:MAG: helix-turn-helix transcriptional regulator [Pseudomonadota bacterium]
MGQLKGKNEPKTHPGRDETLGSLNERLDGLEAIVERDRRKRVRSEGIGPKSANFLRCVREASGLSQSDLAARMGTRQPAVSKLERGGAMTSGPSVGMISDFVSSCDFRLGLVAIPDNDLDRKMLCTDWLPDILNRNVATLLSALEITYLVTDENDTIIFANDFWKSLHPGMDEWTRDGVYYPDYLKAGIDYGMFPEASNDPNWLRRRLQRHYDASEEPPFNVRRQDSRLLQVNEAHTTDGGRVTIARNIAPTRVLEELLAQTRPPNDDPG